MKVGLALGGGGVKGMSHTGVLKVLEEERVQVDLIAGTSAGAIAGALWASGKTAEEIQRLARKLGFRKWFARDTTGLGLFSTSGIHRLIDLAVGEDVNVEDLPRRFMCVAVDLEGQQEVVIDSGPLADAVCASAAYPGLYAPVRVGERMLFDGGVLNPVPFDVLRRYGADRVIAVDLGAPEPFFAALDASERQPGNVLWQMFYTMSHQQIFRVIERSIGIMGQQLRKQKLEQSPPDVIIYPQVREIGLLDFHLIEQCFAAGEQATRLMIPEVTQAMRPPRRPSVADAWLKQVGRLKRALASGRAGSA